MGPRPGQKTVLITGCTPGGIGHALCEEFHARGLHVIATARRLSVLDGYVDRDGFSLLQLDVTDQDSIARCKAEVEAVTGGTLDILVNNAGCTHTHPATDVSLPDARRTFETNFFSVIAMVNAFVPLLIPARGLIINIASLAAVTPYVFGAVYCASKGALVSYSRTLRLELRPLGVRVLVSMTGTVKSMTATQPVRSLPEESYYARVGDLFQRRLTWSQNNRTVEGRAFARGLVRDALGWEVPGWMRAWFPGARRDWVWRGGLATTVYWGWTLLGEWIVDAVSWRKFGLEKLERMVENERKAK